MTGGADQFNGHQQDHAQYIKRHGYAFKLMRRDVGRHPHDRKGQYDVHGLIVNLGKILAGGAVQHEQAHHQGEK